MNSTKRVQPREAVRQVSVRMPADVFLALLEVARREHRSLSSALSLAAARYVEESLDAQAARETLRAH